MMQDRFINIKGVKTRYWDEGHGEHTIVLVHGVAACAEYWEKNFSVLSDYARVIALDLIGFGQTDKPNIAYTHELFARFLKDFLDAINIKKCILVGHSMGGGVSLAFTLDYPQYVEQLVLVSSAGFDRQLPLTFRLVGQPILGKLLVQTQSRKALSIALRRFAYCKEGISNDLIKNAHQYFNSKGAKNALLSTFYHHVDMGGIRKNILALVQEKISVLTMPVILIWGDKDKLLLIRGADKAKKLIPQATIYKITDCGHFPQLEYPAKVNQLILALIFEKSLA